MNKDTIASSSLATPPTNRAVRRRASHLQGIPTRQGAQPLGTTAKSASARSAAALTGRYALQDCARTLLPRERVAMCLRRVQEGVSGPSAVYVAATQSAHFQGLVTCASVWMCPICASRITEVRRKELQAALKAARRMGYKVVMCTYTFSHSRVDVLQEILGKLLGAFRSYKSGRRSQQIREQFAQLGYIRALEVTHSLDNGYHPHIHELVFLPQRVDVQAFGVVCRAAWEDAAGAKGLSMNDHGFQVDDCDARIADYVTKFGRQPKEDGWNEAAELTKWHMKKGQTAHRTSDEHITPFGLLQYAMQGDLQAGALFVEYARAFKGRRQLLWSPGLRAALGLKQEKTDKEIVDEHEEQGQVMVVFTRQEWKIVLGNACRAELLLEVRTGDPLRVFAFLADLGIQRTSLPHVA